MLADKIFRLRPVLPLVLAVLFFVPAAAGLATAAPSAPQVRVIEIEGAIDPVVATYLLQEIDRAEKMEAEALLVKMDTPGGLDVSMRRMIQRMMASSVPIIVYTSPAGARAASAGTFISYAAHLAVMAPGTTIGAAHPVNLGGGDIDDEMSKKIENDAAAFIRGIAKQRERNAEWAEDAVRKSVSATAEEAAELDVIDFTARSTKDLLSQADGRTVKLPDGPRELDLKGAELIESPMGFRQRLLHALVDPNIIFILMTLGIYGIIYELANPGFGFSGIGGAILLVLALFGLQALPINIAGLALIVMAFAFLIAEAFTPTFGILGSGGVIALILGSLILIDAPRDQLAISGWVIAPVALITLLFLVVVVRAAWRAHHQRPVSGKIGMIGLEGKAAGPLNPVGQVMVHGEVWSAEAVDPPIKIGQPIKVVDIEGLKLKVEKLEKKEG
jgi:membrane-bound serine protease (ClpP class)